MNNDRLNQFNTIITRPLKLLMQGDGLTYTKRCPPKEIKEQIYF